MSTSKTGKHGHAKCNFVALDIFTNKKMEDMCPSSHNCEVPNISRKDFLVIDIAEDGFLSLMDEETSEYCATLLSLHPSGSSHHQPPPRRSSTRTVDSRVLFFLIDIPKCPAPLSGSGLYCRRYQGGPHAPQGHR